MASSGPQALVRGKTYSLRRRLLLLMTVAVTLIWFATAGVAFKHTTDEADEVFDAQLVQTGGLLLGIVAGADVEYAVRELREHAHRYRMPVFYQLWLREDGRERLLARSANAPTDAIATAAGFSFVLLQDQRWRVYVRDDEKRYRVVVGQRDYLRSKLARELAEHLLVPMAWSLPLLALGIWLVVTRALRPLKGVAATVEGMDVRNLAPLRLVDPCPLEVGPLLTAIDALTERVGWAMEQERRFTADAAHELRTPLAALKVQAQVAGRTSDPAARAHALGQVLAGVERMTHLVQQLLTLARLEPHQSAPTTQRVDLAQTAAVACAELAPRALARDQVLELDAPDPVMVRMEPAWAEILLRNLIDNALRYGRDAGRVEVKVALDGGEALIEVRDDGPGVEPALRGRLLERFYRGLDGDVEGCGLGLSIVGRLVDLAGARLSFSDGLQRPGGAGLAVEIRIPLAPVAQS